MGGDLIATTIGDLPIHVGDGNYSSKYPKASDFVKIGIPFISASDLCNGRIDPTNFRFISAEQHSKLLKGHIKPGDVLIVTRGNGTGDVAWVDAKYDDFNINAQLVLLRTDEKVLHNRFLYFLLSSKKYKAMCVSYSSGSAQPQLPIKSLKEIDLKYPSYKKQVEIAQQLSALDDKIELNRQTNETLEAMAQALFKSWFVDFDPVIDNALAAGNEIPEPLKARAAARQVLGDARKPLPEETRREFPDGFEFVDEMGWVPRGWVPTTLGEHVDFKTGPAFKSKEFSSEGTRLARGDNVKEGYFHWDSKTRYWPEVSEEMEQFLLKEGDVLIGMDGSKVGKNRVRVRGMDMPCLLVQRVALLRRIDTVCDNFLVNLINTQLFRDYVDRVKTGSAIPHISGPQIKAFPLVLPRNRASPIFLHYETLSSPNSKKSDLASTESEVLSNLRDTLLPKLLSGQLTIPDAEKLVSNAL